MKKHTMFIMLFTALNFSISACQNNNQKAEEIHSKTEHSESDGNNHSAETSETHGLDSTIVTNHDGHEHAPGDTTHREGDGHNH